MQTTFWSLLVNALCGTGDGRKGNTMICDIICFQIDGLQAVRKKIEDDATATHDKFKGVTFGGEGGEGEAIEGFEDEGDMPEEEEREGMYGEEEVEDAAMS